ncbi:MAG TPA: argininosuccinate synthase domain-containing protein [Vicinamibacterales bacterium]|nr:argininosuccinate synthase domain-containing protein [Vicinamibacterales bacterium]
MMSKVVVACFGDPDSARVIAELASRAEVIAVAFDFGGAVSLSDMRDLALAAGAARCHALDVREEFAREVLVPASRSGLFADPVSALAGLAAPFVAGKLQEIAGAEQAVCMLPEHVHVPRRAVAQPVIDPLHVSIRFEDGLPVAINGVDMTLTELLESLETITGEPALAVLQRACRDEPAPQLHQIA